MFFHVGHFPLWKCDGFFLITIHSHFDYTSSDFQMSDENHHHGLLSTIFLPVPLLFWSITLWHLWVKVYIKLTRVDSRALSIRLSLTSVLRSRALTRFSWAFSQFPCVASTRATLWRTCRGRQLVNTWFSQVGKDISSSFWGTTMWVSIAGRKWVHLQQGEEKCVKRINRMPSGDFLSFLVHCARRQTEWITNSIMSVWVCEFEQEK